MLPIVFGSVIAACVALNAAASIAVVRDSALTGAQRRLQLVLIWVLPVVGAALTYFLRRLTSTVPTVGKDQDDPSQVVDIAMGAHSHHHD